MKEIPLENTSELAGDEGSASSKKLENTVGETLSATIDTSYQSRPSPPPNNLFTYRRLRKMIGLLGIALPIVLILLSLFPFFNTDIQPSISDYYYTHLR